MTVVCVLVSPGHLSCELSVNEPRQSGKAPISLLPYPGNGASSLLGSGWGERSAAHAGMGSGCSEGSPRVQQIVGSTSKVEKLQKTMSADASAG